MFLSQARFYAAPMEELRVMSVTHVPMAHSENLGDDIQALAASRIFETEEFVDRDAPHTWPDDAVVVLCGWWNKPVFPIRKKVRIVSMHLASGARASFEDPNVPEWFRDCVNEQGFPAMCRDTDTCNFLLSHGIDAVFSPCLTCYLQAWWGEKTQAEKMRAENVRLAIDVLPTKGEIFCTHVRYELEQMTFQQRIQLAQEQILNLARAVHVRTKRLHAWLPCLALGTPVQLDYNLVTEGPNRFSGYIGPVLPMYFMSCRACPCKPGIELKYEHKYEHYNPWFMAFRKPQMKAAFPDLKELWPGIPGFFDFLDVYREMVARAHDGDFIVELGSLCGRSTVFLGQTIRESGKDIKVLAIDTWPADYECGDGTHIETPELIVKANIAQSFLQDIIHPIRVSSMLASRFIRADLFAVMVDASHNYDNVLADIDLWWPKIRKGGVMAGHDYTSSYPGVMHAVNARFKKCRVIGQCWWVDK